jgi:hypothetical protein
MLLRIDEREHELLLELLHTAMGNLREEIYKTETTDYRAMLMEREKVLTGLLEGLAALESSGLDVHAAPAHA